MSDWAEQSQSIILCEGFHDRAFWQGLLLHQSFGCTDPGLKPGLTARVTVKDPWGNVVSKGRFAYRSRSGRCIIVAPCHGKTLVLPQAKTWLEERDARPIAHLVLNVDSDTNADGTPNDGAEFSHEAVKNTLRKLDPGVQETVADGFLMDGKATKITIVRWSAQDAHTPCLPNQQSLERLACAALTAAYPERGPCIQNWLTTRYDPPKENVKAFAWSHMAGWYSEHGCDDFYRHLWDDDRVRAELETRLKASGAWQIAEALVS